MKQRKIMNKWDLPGWKFEPGYSPRTLVGDWFEERKIVSETFYHESQLAITT